MMWKFADQNWQSFALFQSTSISCTRSILSDKCSQFSSSPGAHGFPVHFLSVFLTCWIIKTTRNRSVDSVVWRTRKRRKSTFFSLSLSRSEMALEIGTCFTRVHLHWFLSATYQRVCVYSNTHDKPWWTVSRRYYESGVKYLRFLTKRIRKQEQWRRPARMQRISARRLPRICTWS